MPRPRQIDDNLLLQRAMRIFWERGFATTGIRELEQGLGLKAPAIYHRFGSKDALFQAALDHYIEHIVDYRIRRYLQATEAPLSGLRAFFDSTYNYMNPRQQPLACLLINTSLETIGSEPMVASRLLEGARRVHNAFTQCLEQAQKCGQLDAESDSRTLASVLYLGLQGLLVSSKVVRDPAQLQRQVDHLFSVLPYTAPRWVPAPTSITEPHHESPAHP